MNRKELIVPSGIDADFCMIVEGDNMVNARIFPGDVVFIKQCPVEDGDIAVVRVGEKAEIGRVVLSYDGVFSIQPESPLYRSLVFSGDELDSIEILGKVTASMFAVSGRP